MCLQGIDLSCCPAYVVSVDESGTVKYVGVGGVKIRGEKAADRGVIRSALTNV